MDCSFIDQETIQVDVTFYDQTEKERLLKYPSADLIEEVTSQQIEIPVAEFLTYYLFHRKRNAKPGWSSFEDIRWKVGRAISDLEDFIIFNGKSLSTAPDVGYQDKGITEHIGESIGLSVINRVHGLTNADWGKLPEKRGKGAPPVFDYEFKHAASDGNMIIQVENKGSSVKDNTVKGQNIYSHKSSIAKKKKALINDNRHAELGHCHVKYGTITTVDPHQNSIAKCWLLDPNPAINNLAPRKLQLINRNRFLYDWISLISPRSHLAASLATRLAALEALENPFELDGVPLKKSSGEDFSFATYPSPWGHASWFANKSKVKDGPAGGVVTQLSNGNLLFLGVREDLLALAAGQKADSILTYKAETASISKNIECVVSKSRFSRMDLPGDIREDAYLSGTYYHFDARGQIHYSPEGTIFGILPVSR